MINRVQYHGHRNGVKEVTANKTGISRQTPRLNLSRTVVLAAIFKEIDSDLLSKQHCHNTENNKEYIENRSHHQVYRKKAPSYIEWNRNKSTRFKILNHTSLFVPAKLIILICYRLWLNTSL